MNGPYFEQLLEGATSARWTAQPYSDQKNKHYNQENPEADPV